MTEIATPNIPGYKILRHLAKGGVGEIWQATSADGRKCAIKVIHPKFAANSKFRKLFLREIAMTRKLRHPNIVEAIASGETGEELPRPYLVMEYVRGYSLAKLMDALARRGEVMPVPIAVTIVLLIAEALNHAHTAFESPFVHLDVSPRNILLSLVDGRPRLIDFGFAVPVGVAEVEITSMGDVWASKGYVAPERGAGPNEPSHPRMDVYSLAVVLWEILAGDTLFGHSSVPIPHRVVDAQNLGRFREDVGGPLAELIHGSLERDPSRRPQSAKEFCDALIRAVPEIADRREDRLLEWFRQHDWTTTTGPIERVGASASAPPPVAPTLPPQSHSAVTGSTMTPTDHGESRPAVAGSPAAATPAQDRDIGAAQPPAAVVNSAPPTSGRKPALPPMPNAPDRPYRGTLPLTNSPPDLRPDPPAAAPEPAPPGGSPGRTSQPPPSPPSPPRPQAPPPPAGPTPGVAQPSTQGPFPPRTPAREWVGHTHRWREVSDTSPLSTSASATRTAVVSADLPDISAFLYGCTSEQVEWATTLLRAVESMSPERRMGSTRFAEILDASPPGMGQFLVLRDAPTLSRPSLGAGDSLKDVTGFYAALLEAVSVLHEDERSGAQRGRLAQMTILASPGPERSTPFVLPIAYDPDPTLLLGLEAPTDPTQADLQAAAKLLFLSLTSTESRAVERADVEAFVDANRFDAGTVLKFGLGIRGEFFSDARLFRDQLRYLAGGAGSGERAPGPVASEDPVTSGGGSGADRSEPVSPRTMSGNAGGQVHPAVLVGGPFVLVIVLVCLAARGCMTPDDVPHPTDASTDHPPSTDTPMDLWTVSPPPPQDVVVNVLSDTPVFETSRPRSDAARPSTRGPISGPRPVATDVPPSVETWRPGDGPAEYQRDPSNPRDLDVSERLRPVLLESPRGTAGAQENLLRSNHDLRSVIEGAEDEEVSLTFRRSLVRGFVNPETCLAASIRLQPGHASPMAEGERSQLLDRAGALRVHLNVPCPGAL